MRLTRARVRNVNNVPPRLLLARPAGKSTRNDCSRRRLFLLSLYAAACSLAAPTNVTWWATRGQEAPRRRITTTIKIRFSGNQTTMTPTRRLLERVCSLGTGWCLERQQGRRRAAEETLHKQPKSGSFNVATMSPRPRAWAACGWPAWRLCMRSALAAVGDPLLSCINPSRPT